MWNLNSSFLLKGFYNFDRSLLYYLCLGIRSVKIKIKYNETKYEFGKITYMTPTIKLEKKTSYISLELIINNNHKIDYILMN